MTKPMIETLVQDIHKLLIEGKVLSDDEAAEFGNKMADMIKKRLHPRPKKTRGTLRMSNIGKPDRQLWYEVNMPDKAEPLTADMLMKFLIGDVTEEILLFLAKHSGHVVEGQQDKASLYGIVGHRDAIIDGVTVDVKSASPFSFKKFEHGLREEDDVFGYRVQLQSYIKSGEDDHKVADTSRGGFLALQKVSGHIVLDLHNKTSQDLEELYEHKKEVVSKEEPPERCYEPEPFGKSGNKKLGVSCSYCSFKKICHPGLRTFLYSTGPVFLTEVVKTPDVYEVLD